VGMSGDKPDIGSSGLGYWWVAVLVIIVDQLTKFWIERNLVFGDALHVLPVLDIVRAHNTGAAFSFLATAGGWQRWMFSGVAVVVSLLLVYWLRTLSLATHKLLATGLTLILGGAIGNVIDRFEHGYVVDFVHAHWGDAYFPAFNVADAGISIGAALVVLDALLEWLRGRNA
jgi:signal peptidase II